MPTAIYFISDEKILNFIWLKPWDIFEEFCKIAYLDGQFHLLLGSLVQWMVGQKISHAKPMTHQSDLEINKKKHLTKSQGNFWLDC